MLAACLSLVMFLSPEFVPEPDDFLRFQIDRREVWNQKAFCSTYIDNLQGMYALAQDKSAVEQALSDARRCFQFLDALDDAARDKNDNFPLWKLYGLNRLYHFLGPDNYYRGRLPPPVPLWRFIEID